MPTGTLIQKIQRHSKYVVMKPPTGGPSTGPISAGTVSQASEPTSSCLATLLRITSRPTGIIIEPPIPWTIRAATISGIELDNPQAIEPSGEDDDGEAEDRCARRSGRRASPRPG